ncbi:MAG: MFS transporter [Armatimonadetes bacterium]|nr:MFS transporter [Armatimonadota bacterium]
MQRSRLGIIFLIVIFDMLAFGLVVPQLGVYAKLYQASGKVQGLLVASYSIMQFVFAPLLGRWSDRVGRKPVLLYSLFTSFVAHVLFAFSRSLAVLFAARLIDGFGGANISTAQAYISDVTPKEKRSHAMAIIGVSFGLGFVFGPAFGGIAGHFGTQWWGPHGGSIAIGSLAAICSLVTLILTGLVLHESLPEEERGHARKLRLLDLNALADAFRDPVLARLLLIMLVSTSGFAVMHAVMPYFVVDVEGLQVHQVGDMAAAQVAIAKVFAWIGVLAILVQGGAVRPLVKRYGETRLLQAGLGLMIVGLATLPLAHSLGRMVLLLTPLSAGNALGWVVLPVLLTFYAPAARRGEVLGVSQSLGSIGRILGPLGGGALYDWGRGVPFYVGAALCAVALLLALWVPHEHPAETPVEPVVAVME